MRMEVTPTPTQKRVLFVITKANWGGAQRYVYDLAIAARDAGHEVMVTTGSEGELTKRLRDAGISVESIGSMGRDIRLKGDVDSFIALIKVVRAFRPDIVHTNSSKAGGLAAVAARIGGAKRVIFTAHGWAFNEDRPRWQKVIIAVLHYATVVLSDETICVSNAVQHDARYMVGVQKRLVVIRNGVGPIAFYDRETARAKLAPEATAPLWIGTIAELHPVKQIDVLIRAFASVARTRDDIFLAVMGGGELRDDLQSLIEELQMQGRIKLCGHVAEAPRYLKALDMFVLASRSEALAFAVLEAGMAELPVIGSRVGGIPEVIKSGCGLLVTSGSVAELSDALRVLLTSAEKRSEYARALHERVLRDFSKERMVADTLARYTR